MKFGCATTLPHTFNEQLYKLYGMHVVFFCVVFIVIVVVVALSGAIFSPLGCGHILQCPNDNKGIRSMSVLYVVSIYILNGLINELAD